MARPILRQLVIAAESIETADLLAQVLELGAPYVDPGVGVFDLENRVYALGDQFLEVVAPLKETAPVARFLERGGEGGYMVLIQTDDMASVRARADAMGVRRVWNSDLPEILASHLHPADMGGAILSVDEPRPATSWLWGGADWESQSVSGGITGALITSRAPEQTAARWAEVTGGQAAGGLLHLEGSAIEFHEGEDERLTGFVIAVSDPARTLLRAAGLGLDVTGNEISLGGVELVIEPF